MGFLQNLTAKLFAKQGAAATGDWAKNLTDDDIATYEKQGLDMTPYRKIRDEERERKRQVTERSIAAQDLSKLDPKACSSPWATCRPTGSCPSS